MNAALLPANHIDGNVMARRSLKSLTVEKRKEYIFKLRVRFTIENEQIEVMGSEHTIAVHLKKKIDAGVVSVNAPDVVMCTKRLAGNKGCDGTFDFYTPRGEKTHILERLCTKKAQQLLHGLTLKTNESLHVYQNGITLHSLAQSEQDILNACHYLAALAQFLSVPHYTAKPQLPKLFATLQELADKWAISDDSERADKLANATKEDLAILIDAVKPNFEQINRNLLKHDREDAHVLRALAETTTEAMLQMSKKNAD
jgi:hypothetical protein